LSPVTQALGYRAAAGLEVTWKIIPKALQA
jgi:hypothetical protein